MIYAWPIDKYSSEGLLDELRNIPYDEFLKKHYSWRSLTNATYNNHIAILDFWYELYLNDPANIVLLSDGVIYENRIIENECVSQYKIRKWWLNLILNHNFPVHYQSYDETHDPRDILYLPAFFHVLELNFFTWCSEWFNDCDYCRKCDNRCRKIREYIIQNSVYEYKKIYLIDVWDIVLSLNTRTINFYLLHGYEQFINKYIENDWFIISDSEHSQRFLNFFYEISSNKEIQEQESAGVPEIVSSTNSVCAKNLCALSLSLSLSLNTIIKFLRAIDLDILLNDSFYEKTVRYLTRTYETKSMYQSTNSNIMHRINYSTMSFILEDPSLQNLISSLCDLGLNLEIDSTFYSKEKHYICQMIDIFPSLMRGNNLQNAYYYAFYKMDYPFMKLLKTLGDPPQMHLLNLFIYSLDRTKHLIVYPWFETEIGISNDIFDELPMNTNKENFLFSFLSYDDQGHPHINLFKEIYPLFFSDFLLNLYLDPHWGSGSGSGSGSVDLINLTDINTSHWCLLSLFNEEYVLRESDEETMEYLIKIHQNLNEKYTINKEKGSCDLLGIFFEMYSERRLKMDSQGVKIFLISYLFEQKIADVINEFNLDILIDETMLKKILEYGWIYSLIDYERYTGEMISLDNQNLNQCVLFFEDIEEAEEIVLFICERVSVDFKYEGLIMCASMNEIFFQSLVDHLKDSLDFSLLVEFFIRKYISNTYDAYTHYFLDSILSLDGVRVSIQKNLFDCLQLTLPYACHDLSKYLDQSLFLEN